MTDKLFDEHVKSKLEQYDSGAPMNVWERIKDNKDENPKGIFFWWQMKYWLFLGAFLIVSGTGYLFFQKNNNTPAASISIKTDGSQSANSIPSVKTTIENKNTSTSENSSATPLKVNIDMAKNDNQNTSITTKEKNKVFIQEAGATKNTFVKSKNKNNIVLTTTKKNNRISPNTGTTTFSNVKEQNEINPNTIVSEQQLSLAGYFQKASKFQFQLGNIAMPNYKPSCPTINGPRRRDLYLEAYVAPDFHVRSLSGSAVPVNYLTERRDNENYRTSYSAGVRIVKNIGEKTLIKAGLNYSQINERLRMITENAKQLTQVITIRTVIRSPGDTLFVRDTLYFEQNGTRYRTTYNRYRFIDLPIIFSYEFGNPDLIHFAISAGAVFNITSFYSGEVLDSSYKSVRISTNSGSNANNWRNNIGVGVFASIAMYKKVNDRMHLFAEPYLRYNLNPVTQQSSYIKQRYMVTGVQLGIRYNLLPPKQRYR